jgi:GSH-dependent disulfide-bond oxidoreductase
MIDIYGGGTPNVLKPLIALEEMGLEYKRLPVDLLKGEQFTPEFLAISPNNRVPAMVDHDPADGQGPLSVFESGAMLLYLADKTGSFIPTDARGRSVVVEWIMWQMAGQGPMLGQAGHFRNYAPEKIPYGIERYSNEARRLYRVLDTRLAERDYVAGDYSIADMCCWPWTLFRAHHGVELGDFPNLERWYHRIEERPAVQRLLPDFQVSAPPSFTEEERKLLFGQKG